MIVFEATPKVPLSELLDDFSYEFPEVPAELLENFLRRAATQMCRDGDLVRHVTGINVQGGVDNYLLEPLDDTEVVAILGLSKLDGNGLAGPPVRLTHKPRHFTCWGVVSWFEPPNTIHIHDGSQYSCYEVEFSTAPTRTACELDAVLARDNYELLLTGARAFALTMVNKPWTDQNLGQVHKAEFVRGIQAAKIDQMTGGQRGAIRARYQRVV